MQKVIQMSQRQISENGEEKSMSLQEVFLVNHSLLENIKSLDPLL